MSFSVYTSTGAALTDVSNAAAYVTSLPSSPYDGQTVVYAADASNGVMWTLRYRAASSSSYKWEFVGGPPMSAYNYDSGAVTTSGTAYTTVTYTNPSVTLPLAGDYVLQASGQTTLTGATARTDVRLNIVAGSSVKATSAGSHYAQYAMHQHSVSARADALAASTVIKTGHESSATSVGIQTYNTTIEAIPVRVG